MPMLKPGDKAPGFRLPNDDGNEVALADFRGRHVVLFFFVKALTSGWNHEASEFRDAKPDFDKLNAIVLGCSADAPELMGKFRARFKINFPLLSDPEFQAIEAYGARRMKSFLGKSFLGIVRSTVWVGPDGKIRKVWDKVSPQGHAAEVVAALKSA